MNKEEILFEFRSSGGKACKKKYGIEYYKKLAKLSHAKRKRNKKLSTSK